MADKLTVGLSRPMPGYQRPDPDVTATPINAPTRQRFSTAAPIRSEPTSTFTPIALAHKQIEDALTAFENAGSDIAAAEQRGELTPEGRAAAVTDAGAPALDAIDKALAQAADRAERADTDYRAARTGLSPDLSTSLDVVRHNQWWSRTVCELDATPAEKLVGAAQRLIETADGPELGWASVELPSYLRSRNAADGWVNGALQQASPMLKAAAAQRKLATQANAIIASNARAAKRAMASAGQGSYRRPTLTDVSTYDPNS
jgi:hypothetical protein